MAYADEKGKKEKTTSTTSSSSTNSTKTTKSTSSSSGKSWGTSVFGTKSTGNKTTTVAKTGKTTKTETSGSKSSSSGGLKWTDSGSSGSSDTQQSTTTTAPSLVSSALSSVDLGKTVKTNTVAITPTKIESKTADQISKDVVTDNKGQGNDYRVKTGTESNRPAIESETNSASKDETRKERPVISLGDSRKTKEESNEDSKEAQKTETPDLTSTPESSTSSEKEVENAPAAETSETKETNVSGEGEVDTITGAQPEHDQIELVGLEDNKKESAKTPTNEESDFSKENSTKTSYRIAPKSYDSSNFKHQQNKTNYYHSYTDPETGAFYLWQQVALQDKIDGVNYYNELLNPTDGSGVPWFSSDEVYDATAELANIYYDCEKLSADESLSEEERATATVVAHNCDILIDEFRMYAAAWEQLGDDKLIDTSDYESAFAEAAEAYRLAVAGLIQNGLSIDDVKELWKEGQEDTYTSDSRIFDENTPFAEWSEAIKEAYEEDNPKENPLVSALSSTWRITDFISDTEDGRADAKEAYDKAFQALVLADTNLKQAEKQNDNIIKARSYIDLTGDQIDSKISELQEKIDSGVLDEASKAEIQSDIDYLTERKEADEFETQYDTATYLFSSMDEETKLKAQEILTTPNAFTNEEIKAVFGDKLGEDVISYKTETPTDYESRYQALRADLQAGKKVDLNELKELKAKIQEAKENPVSEQPIDITTSPIYQAMNASLSVKTIDEFESSMESALSEHTDGTAGLYVYQSYDEKKSQVKAELDEVTKQMSELSAEMERQLALSEAGKENNYDELFAEYQTLLAKQTKLDSEFSNYTVLANNAKVYTTIDIASDEDAKELIHNGIDTWDKYSYLFESGTEKVKGLFSGVTVEDIMGILDLADNVEDAETIIGYIQNGNLNLITDPETTENIDYVYKKLSEIDDSELTYTQQKMKVVLANGANNFYYVLGKYGLAEALKYGTAYTNYVNSIVAADKKSEIESNALRTEKYYSDGYFTANVIATPFITLLPSLTGLADTVSNLWDYATIGNFQTDSDLSLSQWASANNSAVSKAIDQATGGKTFLTISAADVYGAYTSAIQSTASLLIGNAMGSVLGLAGKSLEVFTKAYVSASFFGNAAASSTEELLSQGLDPSKVLSLSLWSGLCEALFEDLSLDKAYDIFFSAKIPSKISGAVLNAFIAAGIEGSEEVATSMANAFGEWWILKDESEFSQKIAQYNKDHNITDPDDKSAYTSVYLDYALQFWKDFATGAISSLGSTGVTSAGRYQYQKALGAQFEAAGKVAQNGYEYIHTLAKNGAFDEANAVEREEIEKLSDQLLHNKLSEKERAGAAGKLINLVDSIDSSILDDFMADNYQVFGTTFATRTMNALSKEAEMAGINLEELKVKAVSNMSTDSVTLSNLCESVKKAAGEEVSAKELADIQNFVMHLCSGNKTLTEEKIANEIQYGCLKNYKVRKAVIDFITNQANTYKETKAKAEAEQQAATETAQQTPAAETTQAETTQAETTQAETTQAETTAETEQTTETEQTAETTQAETTAEQATEAETAETTEAAENGDIGESTPTEIRGISIEVAEAPADVESKEYADYATHLLSDVWNNGKQQHIQMKLNAVEAQEKAAEAIKQRRQDIEYTAKDLEQWKDKTSVPFESSLRDDTDHVTIAGCGIARSTFVDNRTKGLDGLTGKNQQTKVDEETANHEFDVLLMRIGTSAFKLEGTEAYMMNYNIAKGEVTKSGESVQEQVAEAEAAVEEDQGDTETEETAEEPSSIAAELTPELTTLNSKIEEDKAKLEEASKNGNSEVEAQISETILKEEEEVKLQAQVFASNEIDNILQNISGNTAVETAQSLWDNSTSYLAEIEQVRTTRTEAGVTKTIVDALYEAEVNQLNKAVENAYNLLFDEGNTNGQQSASTSNNSDGSSNMDNSGRSAETEAGGQEQTQASGTESNGQSAYSAAYLLRSQDVEPDSVEIAFDSNGKTDADIWQDTTLSEGEKEKVIKLRKMGVSHILFTTDDLTDKNGTRFNGKFFSVSTAKGKEYAFIISRSTIGNVNPALFSEMRMDHESFHAMLNSLDPDSRNKYVSFLIESAFYGRENMYKYLFGCYLPSYAIVEGKVDKDMNPVIDDELIAVINEEIVCDLYSGMNRYYDRETNVGTMYSHLQFRHAMSDLCNSVRTIVYTSGLMQNATLAYEGTGETEASVIDIKALVSELPDTSAFGLTAEDFQNNVDIRTNYDMRQSLINWGLTVNENGQIEHLTPKAEYKDIETKDLAAKVDEANKKRSITSTPNNQLPADLKKKAFESKDQWRSRLEAAEQDANIEYFNLASEKRARTLETERKVEAEKKRRAEEAKKEKESKSTTGTTEQTAETTSTEAQSETTEEAKAEETKKKPKRKRPSEKRAEARKKASKIGTEEGRQEALKEAERKKAEAKKKAAEKKAKEQKKSKPVAENSSTVENAEPVVQERTFNSKKEIADRINELNREIQAIQREADEAPVQMKRGDTISLTGESKRHVDITDKVKSQLDEIHRLEELYRNWGNDTTVETKADPSTQKARSSKKGKSEISGENAKPTKAIKVPRPVAIQNLFDEKENKPQWLTDFEAGKRKGQVEMEFMSDPVVRESFAEFVKLKNLKGGNTTSEIDYGGVHFDLQKDGAVINGIKTKYANAQGAFLSAFGPYAQKYGNKKGKSSKGKMSVTVQNEAQVRNVIPMESEDTISLVSQLGENAEVVTDKDGNLLVASNDNTALYSATTYKNGGRQALIDALYRHGHTEQEVIDTVSQIDDALDYLQMLAAYMAKEEGADALAEHLSQGAINLLEQDSESRDKYIKLGGNLAADITTNVKTGKQALSTLVKNSDYPVNLDLALICKKRVAYMNVMQTLIDDGFFDTIEYDSEAIAATNEILRNNGFETACLGCFVESRRLLLQSWANDFVTEWNAEVDKRVKDPKNVSNIADLDIHKLSNDDVLKLQMEFENEGEKNNVGNHNLGQGKSQVRMGRLIDKNIAAAKDGKPSLLGHLRTADLLTPEGLKNIRAFDPDLFSLIISRYGANSPKIVQEYNPYNAEVANLTFKLARELTNKAVEGSQAFVDAAKEDLEYPVKAAPGETSEELKKRQEKWKEDWKSDEKQREIEELAIKKYLFSIGGVRIQSFSDFMIENVFDYLQIFADLSARRLPIHGYTKEAICLRLFGRTGAKWNGSLIAHVESSKGKEMAGLLDASEADKGNAIRVEYNGKPYAIAFDDYYRHTKTDSDSYIQSIGLRDILALQLDPRYADDVGSITIGLSDPMIFAMLDNDFFRMVIPYHKSGISPEYAALMHIDSYNDYSDVTETHIKQCYDIDGNETTAKKLGVSEEKITSFSFNTDLQKTGDARRTARNYVEWCKRHPVYNKEGKKVGYATCYPKFYTIKDANGVSITEHRNYYKVLEDFNVYNCITEDPAPQKSVALFDEKHNSTLPSAQNKLTDEQLAEYRQRLINTGVFKKKNGIGADGKAIYVDDIKAIDEYCRKAQLDFKELISEEIKQRADYDTRQAPLYEPTINEIKERLTEINQRKAEEKKNAPQKKTRKKKDVSKNSISIVTPEQDQAYLDAVSANDMETAQKMVDEAAVANGYTLRKFHQTGNRFNVFDLSRGDHSDGELIFPYGIFTKNTDKKIGLKGNIQMELYVNPGNTLHVKDREEFKSLLPNEYSELLHQYKALDSLEKDLQPSALALAEAERKYIESHPGEDYKQGSIISRSTFDDPECKRALADCQSMLNRMSELESARDFKAREYVTDWMRDNGYDSIDVEIDRGRHRDQVTDAFIVMDNTRVKLTDAVTYDDQGNVIPLSERFNASNEDIRYSITPNDIETALGIDITDEEDGYGVKNVEDLSIPQIDWLLKKCDTEITKGEPTKTTYQVQTGLARLKTWKNNPPDELFANAKNAYGTTDDFYKSGYILPDGTMLDMSAGTNRREFRHWDVKDVVENTAYDFMNDSYTVDFFVAKGAVRIDTESDGIQIPWSGVTDAQIDVLRNYFETYVNTEDFNHVYFYVEATDVTPFDSKSTFAKLDPTNEDRFINTLKKYNRDGKFLPDYNAFESRWSVAEEQEFDTRYSLSTEADIPQKTMIGYKVFRAKDGQLYPTKVKNPGGQGTPLGVWLNADTGTVARDKDGNIIVNKNGRIAVKSTDGTLAWRPGWHLGSLPEANQMNRVDPNNPESNNKNKAETGVMWDDYVFCEVEFAADNDYQLEAFEMGMTENGTYSHSQAGLPYIPKDGYYKYRTNPDPSTAPWFISGQIRITKILDDPMRREIIEKWNAEHPDEQMRYTPRYSGKDINLADFGLKAGPVEVTTDLSNIAEGIDLSDEIKKLPGYTPHKINWDNEGVQKAFKIQQIEDKYDYYKDLYEREYAPKYDSKLSVSDEIDSDNIVSLKDNPDIRYSTSEGGLILDPSMQKLIKDSSDLLSRDELSGEITGYEEKDDLWFAREPEETDKYYYFFIGSDEVNRKYESVAVLGKTREEALERAKRFYLDEDLGVNSIKELTDEEEHELPEVILEKITKDFANGVHFYEDYLSKYPLVDFIGSYLYYYEHPSEANDSKRKRIAKVWIPSLLMRATEDQKLAVASMAVDMDFVADGSPHFEALKSLAKSMYYESLRSLSREFNDPIRTGFTKRGGEVLNKAISEMKATDNVDKVYKSLGNSFDHGDVIRRMFYEVLEKESDGDTVRRMEDLSTFKAFKRYVDTITNTEDLYNLRVVIFGMGSDYVPIIVSRGVLNNAEIESAINALIFERADYLHESQGRRDKGTLIENREYTLQEIKDIFYRSCEDKELLNLAEKVFKTAEVFGINAVGYPEELMKSKKLKSGVVGGMYYSRTRSVSFNTDAAFRKEERWTAEIILHELIHSVTCYCIESEDASNPFHSDKLSEEQRAAAKTILDIYDSLKKDDPDNFNTDKYYGATNAKEMVAELSNPKFRKYLESKSVFRKLLDAIKRILGIYKEPKNLREQLSLAVEYIVMNPNEAAFNNDYISGIYDSNTTKYSSSENNSDTRFSIAGEVGANKRELSNREVAENMEQQGIDSEKIRLATGWFKGYDGKWKYEIDDSDAQIADFFVQDTKEDMVKAARKTMDELTSSRDSLEAEYDRVFKSTHLSKDIKENRQREILKSINEIDRKIWKEKDFMRRAENNSLYLSDVLKHPKLFRAYPQLKTISVSLIPQVGGKMGAHSFEHLDIVTKDQSVDDILNTIMHEVQHEIQTIEGFAKGSSAEYWKRRGSEEDSAYRNALAILENITKQLKSVPYEGDEINAPSFVAYNYAYYKKQLSKDIRAGHKADVDFDKYVITKSEKLADKGGYRELLNRYLTASQDVDIARMEAENRVNAYDLYYRTAGEVEARDVERRINFPKKERQRIRPDIDRTNVVFADNSNRFSLSEAQVENLDSNFNGVLINEFGTETFSPEFANKFATSTSLLADDSIFRTQDHTTFIPMDDGSIMTIPFDPDSEEVRYIERLKNNDNTNTKGTYTIPRANRNEDRGYSLGQQDAGVRAGENRLSQVDQENEVRTGRSASEVREENKPQTQKQKGIIPAKFSFTDPLADTANASDVFGDYEDSYQGANLSENDFVGHFPVFSSDQALYDYIISGNTDGLEKEINKALEKAPGTATEYMRRIDEQIDQAEGITAEEKAALQKKWDEFLRKYGFIEKGERAKNDIQVPKKATFRKKVKVGNKTVEADVLKNVSKAERTIMENSPEWLNDQAMRALLTKEIGSYTPTTNAKDMDYAKRYFAEHGYERALAHWQDIVESEGIPTSQDIAIAERLLADATAQGHVKDAMQIVADLCLIASELGQAVQAFRMLKLTGPTGNLYYIQKLARRLNKQNEKRISAGKMKKIQIDAALASRIIAAKTQDELDQAMQDMKQDIANQIPMTFGDRVNAWRYMMMLNNPPTHIRNFLGNAAFNPVVRFKNMVAYGLERNSGIKTRGRLINSKNTAYYKFAENDFNDMVDVIMGKSGKYVDINEIKKLRRDMFGSDNNSVAKSMNDLWQKLNDINANANVFGIPLGLENGDMVFLKRYYQESLSQYLEANGADPNNLDALYNTPQGKKLLNKARSWAVREAQRNTYRAFSSVASAINQAKRRGGAWGVLLEGVLPFTSTPINILNRGIEYSPVGFIKGIYDWYNAKNSEMTPENERRYSESLDEIASAITGTMIAAVGVLLASLGMLRGAGSDDDEEYQFEVLQGHQDYSIEIGNHSYTIDWLAPAAIPLFMGEALYKVMSGDKGLDISNIDDVLNQLVDPLTNLTMLSGVNSTLGSLAYAEENATLSTLAVSAASSYFGQFLPTVLGQVARTVDPVRRTTYIDKNSNVPSELQSFIQKSIYGKIPGLTTKRSEYVDAWGRNEVTEPVGRRLLENFLSPGYYSEINETAVDQELSDLYSRTQSSTILPNTQNKKFNIRDENGNVVNKDLTAKEYETLSKEAGQLAYSILENVFNTPEYAAMDDADKIKAIDLVYDYARNVGRSTVSDKYELSDSWIEKAMNTDPTSYILIKGELTDTNSVWGKAKMILDDPNFSAENKAYLLGQEFDAPYTVASGETGYNLILTDGDQEYAEELYSDLYFPQKLDEMLNMDEWKEAEANGDEEAMQELYTACRTEAKALVSKQLSEELANSGRDMKLASAGGLKINEACEILRTDPEAGAEWFAKIYTAGSSLDDPDNLGYKVDLDEFQKKSAKKEFSKRFVEEYNKLISTSSYKSADGTTQDRKVRDLYDTVSDEIDASYARQIIKSGNKTYLADTEDVNYDTRYHILSTTNMSTSEAIDYLGRAYKGGTSINGTKLTWEQKQYRVELYNDILKNGSGSVPSLERELEIIANYSYDKKASALTKYHQDVYKATNSTMEDKFGL